MQGTLILLCGLPGSGKTTVALALQEKAGVVRLSPDEWLIALDLDLWDGDARARVEALQWQLCKRLLEVGLTVALESGFWTRRDRDIKRSEGQALGARVELRYLDVPIQTLWERLRERQDRGAWQGRPIARDELTLWASRLEVPSDEELRLFDAPECEPDER